MADHPVLERFSPAVRAWFAASFPEPTPPQVQGWPHIAAGEHTLIVAPTGSGKTLAAFLWGLNQIAAAQLDGVRHPPGSDTGGCLTPDRRYHSQPWVPTSSLRLRRRSAEPGPEAGSGVRARSS